LAWPSVIRRWQSEGSISASSAQRLNLTPDELDTHLIENGVSDAAHTAMIKPVSPQFDLFAAAA
jgi:hypothetical protein